MTRSLRLAVTADLHWGHRPVGDAAVRALRDFLGSAPPDLLLLGGDQGSLSHFDECLALWAELPCPKAVVAGNHDIWVDNPDPRGDSLEVYHKHLPAACARHGFHYLDHGPLLLPEKNLGVVGSINWYDYSWSLARLQQEVPAWAWHLENKVFSRGRHNDGRYVRWPLDDVRFTRQVVAALAEHLETALAALPQVVVLTHHPAFHGLSFPCARQPSGLDELLWEALGGNTALEELLRAHAERIPLVFSGHTHRQRANTLGTIRGFNVGGDYHFKRLLLIDWPAGTVQAHIFGEAGVHGSYTPGGG